MPRWSRARELLRQQRDLERAGHLVAVDLARLDAELREFIEQRVATARHQFGMPARADDGHARRALAGEGKGLRVLIHGELQ